MPTERPKYYRLDGHAAVPCSVGVWSRLFNDSAACLVKEEWIGDVRVDTVFLGLDHAYQGEPDIFETLVYGGPLDDEIDRYADWSAAEAGHAAMVERVRAAQASIEEAARGH